MRFQLSILAIIFAAVSANMRDMFPLKDRIKMLFQQGDITTEQKEYIMSKISEKMLNQQLVDRNKVHDADYAKLSIKDMDELSLWLDQEVISEHISAETANYARAILDLGPSSFQEPNAKTLLDGPVDADYEGNGIVTKLAWRDYDPQAGGNNLYNGIWGYAKGIREYALHTSYKGLNILDVTDAEDDNIFLVQTIPMTGGNIWRDVAVTEDHYAYVAAQGGTNPHFFSIDLSELSGSSPHGEGSNPISQNNIINHGYSNWGHTINAWNGLVFLNSAYSSRGCEILDARDNPMNPKAVANYSNGDCHDSFAKKIYYKGQLRDLFFVADGFNRRFRIYYITDVRGSNFKFTQIGQTPSTSGIYAHENCVSEDGKTLFTFEEFNIYDIAAYDISDDDKLENPQLISKFQYSLDNEADATVHNGFVHGNYLFVAYYAAGLRVFDISDVRNIVEVGKYDTYLDPDGNGNNNNNPTAQTEGAWNVYPYLPSGNILVSDLVYGLFVVKTEGGDNDDDDDTTSSPTASPTVSEKPCTICDNLETARMINKGQDCTTSTGILNKRCNKNANWRNMKWCQLSCYNSGNGYDGDVCCNDTPPTTSPPTQSPTESCTICDDRENNRMINKGQDCASSTGILTRKCNNSGQWINNKYCQLSCYNNGNGYDGDVCCNGNVV